MLLEHLPPATPGSQFTDSETPLSIVIPAAEGLPVAERNWDNLRKLYHLQETSVPQQGCFLPLGLCALRNALFPNQPLPEADILWDRIASVYPNIFEPGSLLISPNKYAEAFQILRDWGIRLRKYTYNQGAMDFPEWVRSMEDTQVPAVYQATPSYVPLSETGLHLPYGLLMKQSGGNMAHFIAIDGSNESERMRRNYESRAKQLIPYRVIAIFEFEQEIAQAA